MHFKQILFSSVTRFMIHWTYVDHFVVISLQWNTAGKLPIELIGMKMLKLKLSTKLCSILTEVKAVLKQ